MKTKRQAKLLELIVAHKIDTQEGITEALRNEGYHVAQATISRDIQELNIVKVRTNDGGFRYVSQPTHTNVSMSEKFATIFIESIISVNHAQNIVVVKCYTGMANAACAALDSAGIEDVVGSLAGDDTFLIITKDATSAANMTERLNKLLIR